MARKSQPPLAAQVLAILAIATPLACEAAISDAYEVSYTRSAKPAEIKAALGFINQQKKLIEGSTGPHVELASPLVESKYMFGESPFFGAQSVLFKPGTGFEKIHVVTSSDREGEEFTVEAVVYLDSLLSLIHI